MDKLLANSHDPSSIPNVKDMDGFYILNLSKISIAIPKEGNRPVYFLWPRNTSKVLVVVLNGIYEVWMQPYENFRTHLLFNDSESYSEQIMNSIRRRGISDFKIISWLKNLVKETRIDLEAIGEGSGGNTTKIAQLIDALKNLNLSSELKFQVNPMSKNLEEILRKLDKGERESFSELLKETVKQLDDLEEQLHDRLVEIRGKDIAVYEEFLRVPELRNRVFQVAKKLHPFSLSFLNAKWSVSDMKDIIDFEGNKVGVIFSLRLEEAGEHGFDFINKKMEIKNRVYYSPVVENLHEIPENLTDSVLRFDFIITGWKLNYQDVITSLGNHSSLLAPYKPYLGLSLTFYSRNVKGNVVNSLPKLLDGVEDENSGLDVRAQNYNNISEILMALDGNEYYFRFFSKAYLYHTNGTLSTAPVHSTCTHENGGVDIFLLYLYPENEVKIEHDLSIGMSIESREKPRYEVRYVGGRLMANSYDSGLKNLFSEDDLLILLLLLFIFLVLMKPKRKGV